MKVENIRIKVSESLWNLTGFKKSIISECKVDEYHAKIIGVLLLLVGVYATLAWAFFFQTVTENLLIPMIAGLFMGFFIVSFDRALIASLSSGKTNFYGLGFRLILAILLGIFLSQPMILKFYQPEIKREAHILFDKKNLERKVALEKLHKVELADFESQKKELQFELDKKSETLLNAESDFKKEMDGTGGTGKTGYSVISKQKEKIFEGHKEGFVALQKRNLPQIENIQNQINSINKDIANDMVSFTKSNAVFGTLIQAEALQSLLVKDATGVLKTRYYLLVFILTLIELSALIAKMLFKTSGYKSKIKLINDLEVTTSENDREISIAKLNKYKELALVNELASIEKFFEASKENNQEHIKNRLNGSKESKDISLKQHWQKFKEMSLINENLSI